MTKKIGLLAANLLLTLLLTVSARAQSGSDDLTTLPDSQNRLIKLTDNGLSPQELRMQEEDSIVFFLNDSKDSLATFQINFGNHPTHCASTNLRMDKGGLVTSAKPVAPRDFASTCFHEKGTYDFTVYGLRAKPDGVKGRIIVE